MYQFDIQFIYAQITEYKSRVLCKKCKLYLINFSLSMRISVKNDIQHEQSHLVSIQNANDA